MVARGGGIRGSIFRQSWSGHKPHTIIVSGMKSQGKAGHGCGAEHQTCAELHAILSPVAGLGAVRLFFLSFHMHVPACAGTRKAVLAHTAYCARLACSATEGNSQSVQPASLITGMVRGLWFVAHCVTE